MATEVHPSEGIGLRLVQGEFEKLYIRDRSNPEKIKEHIAKYTRLGITQSDIDAAAQLAAKANLSPAARETIAHTQAVQLEEENRKRIERSKLLSKLKVQNITNRK